jgi:hypothetical protein
MVMAIVSLLSLPAAALLAQHITTPVQAFAMIGVAIAALGYSLFSEPDIEMTISHVKSVRSLITLNLLILAAVFIFGSHDRSWGSISFAVLLSALLLSSMFLYHRNLMNVLADECELPDQKEDRPRCASHQESSSNGRSAPRS